MGCDAVPRIEEFSCYLLYYLDQGRSTCLRYVEGAHRAEGLDVEVLGAEGLDAEGVDAEGLG